MNFSRLTTFLPVVIAFCCDLSAVSSEEVRDPINDESSSGDDSLKSAAPLPLTPKYASVDIHLVGLVTNLIKAVKTDTHEVIVSKLAVVHERLGTRIDALQKELETVKAATMMTCITLKPQWKIIKGETRYDYKKVPFYRTFKMVPSVVVG